MYHHSVYLSSSYKVYYPVPLRSGADAIIRQHKAACLRITALLACKDLLWIGTSAGKKSYAIQIKKYFVFIQDKDILCFFILNI